MEVDKNLVEDEIAIRFNSETFIENVCFSYRHDFGLLKEDDKKKSIFECKEWMRAIKNNWKYFK